MRRRTAHVRAHDPATILWTLVVFVGFVIALAGVFLALRACARPRPETPPTPPELWRNR